MQEQKGPNSSLGAKNNCINFNMCPLCYGCRDYRSTDSDCSDCYNENKQFNICNTEKHKTDLIGQFVTKNVIKSNEKINFKSY